MKDRKELIGSLSETAEEAVLLARVWDRMASGERRGIPTATCFLSGREQELVKTLCVRGGLPQPVFFGGFPAAERQVAAYIPDYLEPQDYLQGPDGPISALRAQWSQFDHLTHRDFLGSLMGQGIKRELIGDLLPGEGSCDILVLREMASYLSGQLTQVGRARVQTAEIDLADIAVPEQKVKAITDTVASLRLDSIMASGFRLGRSKAAAQIHAGKVEVNHVTAMKPDTLISAGDVISARGLGKLRVAQVNGLTKKGRISVMLERFL